MFFTGCKVNVFFVIIKIICKFDFFFILLSRKCYRNNPMKPIFLIISFMLSCSTFVAGRDNCVSAPDSVTVPASPHATESPAVSSQGNDSTHKHRDINLKHITKKVSEATTAIAYKTFDVTKSIVPDRLLNYLDSSGVKGADPAYIALPKRKWRVSLTSDMDKMSVDVTRSGSYIPAEGKVENWATDFDFHTPMSASVGLWVGYMGYGAGFSFVKAEQNNTNMSMNMASRNFGLNIRWIRYSTDHGLKGWAEKGIPLTEVMKCKNYAYDITSFVFDGYWLFNKKKFSYSAAYDLSTVQLRSAGSFMAGLMVNYQKCDFSNPDNILLLVQANSIGKVNMFQGSVGGGYSYNWVPTQGLVINITAMPVLTLYSRSKFYRYDWEVQHSETGGDVITKVTITSAEKHSENGKVAFNLNARLAAAYRYKIYVFSLLAQGHYLRSYFENTSFKVFQWNVKATAGITF